MPGAATPPLTAVPIEVVESLDHDYPPELAAALAVLARGRGRLLGWPLASVRRLRDATQDAYRGRIGIHRWRARDASIRRRNPPLDLRATRLVGRQLDRALDEPLDTSDLERREPLYELARIVEYLTTAPPRTRPQIEKMIATAELEEREYARDREPMRSALLSSLAYHRLRCRRWLRELGAHADEATAPMADLWQLEGLGSSSLLTAAVRAAELDRYRPWRGFCEERLRDELDYRTARVQAVSARSRRYGSLPSYQKEDDELFADQCLLIAELVVSAAEEWTTESVEDAYIWADRLGGINWRTEKQLEPEIAELTGHYLKQMFACLASEGLTLAAPSFAGYQRAHTFGNWNLYSWRAVRDAYQPS